jgi:Zn-dependent protease
MNTGSISLGRLVGAAVRIHWSALAVAALLAASMARGVGFGLAIVGVAVFFASILVHELGHALVARRFDIPTSAIELWGLGGFARLEREARTPKAEGWIAAAGPLASFALGGAAIAVAVLGHRAGLGDHVVSLAGWTGLINVVLGLFNLLPGAPLDGGRIVRAVRWHQHGQRYRAMREAGLAGRVIGWGLAGVGLVMMVNGRPGIWILLTGVFVAVNARAEINHAVVGERLAGLKVGEMTWYGIAETDVEMDADSMIDQRQRLGGAGAVVVRNADGQLGGLVLEDQLWAIPSEHRPWVMLTSLMAPFDRLAQADPDDELAMVLPRVNPLRPIVTVWRDGRLLGVIPPTVLRDRLARTAA